MKDFSITLIGFIQCDQRASLQFEHNACRSEIIICGALFYSASATITKYHEQVTWERYLFNLFFYYIQLAII